MPKRICRNNFADGATRSAAPVDPKSRRLMGHASSSPQSSVHSPSPQSPVAFSTTAVGSRTFHSHRESENLLQLSLLVSPPPTLQLSFDSVDLSLVCLCLCIHSWRQLLSSWSLS